MPQDFSGQNLQGRSFKGENLEGANFSGADIRSSDFSGAILRGANFKGVKAGLQRSWATAKLGILFVLSGVSGVALVLAGTLSGGLLTTKFVEENTYIPGIIALGILIVFCVTNIRKGFLAALQAVLIALVAVLIIGYMLAFLLTRIGVLTEIRVLQGVLAASLVVGVFGAMSLGTALALAVTGIIGGVGAGLLAGALALTIAEVFALSVIVIDSGIVAGVVAGCGVMLSTYISQQVLAKKSKFNFIRSLAIAFAATKGTKFQKADLTDANFTKAVLKNVDLTDAILIRTCWLQSQNLDLACARRTYIEDPNIYQLLVTGFGQEQNFDRQDLQGINLHRANLVNASFIDTNFYKSNLQSANLLGAKLVRTQIEQSNLTGATLTGACIEDWVVTKTTKLNNIKCDYVFLKYVNGDKRDQMPPRGKFKVDGFVTFVRYILETVELYHEKDINPKLALTVLQKMSRDYDEPLNIVALGKKGERVFIQVKVSENIIRENFQEDYYSRYEKDWKLWSANPHSLPSAVDSFIEKKINEIVLEKTEDFVFVDATYVEGNYTQIYQGEVNMSGERTINMGDGNYNERIEGNYVQGNYYAAQEQSLADAAAQIQKLLEQLERSYPSNTTTGKMAIATEAIKYIESDRTLAQRVLSALKAGGIEALAQLLNHPAASFVIGALDDWQKTKGS